MGWTRTLASVLIVSLGGIVSSAGAMGSDGFKEVRNGMRGFVCDLSERALLHQNGNFAAHFAAAKFPLVLCAIVFKRP